VNHEASRPRIRLVRDPGAEAVPPAAGAGSGPDGARRGRRVAARLRLPALLVVVALTSSAVTVHLVRGAPAPPGPRNVAVIPYWNLAAGTDAVLAHRAAVDTVSPWMFGVSDTGDVVPLVPEQAGQQQAAVRRLRAAGLKVMPTIANYRDGRWRYDPVGTVLHDPARAARQVRQITRLAVDQGWSGVDLDYEELHAGDRDAFTGFVQALAGALHAEDLTLSVEVFAKTSDDGYDERNRAQDYPAIAAASDQTRVMAYDYHWSTSAPGPIAPADWVRAVLDYTLAHVPAGKVLLGLPLYGYDWVGHRGTVVSWAQVYALATSHGAPVRWDAGSQSPWLRWTDAAGAGHEVWFENAYSSSVKIELARARGVRGVSLWMYGDEDGDTWARLAPSTPGCAVTGGPS